ncbi:hypothetical protein GEMRC1_009154 [Eukaryota sp. GEM-RC1]
MNLINGVVIGGTHNGIVAFWSMYQQIYSTNLKNSKCEVPVLTFNDPYERFISAMLTTSDNSMLVVVYRDSSLACFSLGKSTDDVMMISSWTSHSFEALKYRVVSEAIVCPLNRRVLVSFVDTTTQIAFFIGVL